MVVIIGVLGFFRNFPWQDKNMADVLFEGYSPFTITVSVIPGYLIVVYLILSIYLREDFAVRLGTNRRFQIMICKKIVQSAIVYALIYVIVTFTAGIIYVGDMYKWNNSIGMKFGRVNPFLTGLRTWMVIALFLVMCGLLFYLIVILTHKVIIAFIIVLQILYFDVGLELYFDISLISRYVLPAPIKLYISWNGFAVGITYLIIICLILLAIINYITGIKDNVSLKKKR